MLGLLGRGAAAESGGPIRQTEEPQSARVDTPAREARQEPPNIILFLVDDLGWMDTAVYGSRYYETPNIDRLAAGGMLFTDAYAASPHCSPTRASILTGKYPARLGITTAGGHRSPLPTGVSRYPPKAMRWKRWLVPESRRFLPLEEFTLAEALRGKGYRTAHLGKWHLGRPRAYWPDRQGFEVVLHGGPDAGAGSYFSPYGFQYGNFTDGPEGEYLTDRLTDAAVEFIEASRDRPFFLHLSHFGVHGPWGVKEEVRQRFAERRDPRGKQANPVMAAMISSVDESLGRILGKLEELGLNRRTILIVTSDNGGVTYAGEGRGEVQVTDNSPLRGAKGLLYEGGIRVPLIVSWPGVVEPGSRSAEVVSSIDLYPTLLEAAGVAPPPDQVLDGESLMPLLQQSGGLAPRAVFNYFALSGPRAPPGVAVRSGRWKLIRWFETNPWFPDELELYDLVGDIGETENLAHRMPQRAELLNRSIDDFLATTVVLPLQPNPRYDPRAAARGWWAPRQAEVDIRDGALRCALPKRQSQWPGIELLFLKHVAERRRTGPHRLDLRVRAARAVRGRVELVDPESGETQQTVRFDLRRGSRWREVSLPLLVERAPVSIRLGFRTRARAVEIDSIRLLALDGLRGWPSFTARLEWRFELPSPSPDSISRETALLGAGLLNPTPDVARR